ncbi:MAG: hypothetical protein Q7U28_11035 [Aquabacterium sp.]|nr:hypothetical protein [Aquabacterium sp.]
MPHQRRSLGRGALCNKAHLKDKKPHNERRRVHASAKLTDPLLKHIHALSIHKESTQTNKMIETRTKSAARKIITAHVSSITVAFILLTILFLKITRGLDLTDEIQYYGEIKGLIETGRLFSNDLFIQQTVYILIYPALYIYHKLFNYIGLIFFGRILMAGLCFALFIYSQKRINKITESKITASLCALALTFPISYHGILSPSYNTVSQLMWVIFAINFFEWRSDTKYLWLVIPMVTAFAHPTSALAMILLIMMRLLTEKKIGAIFRLVTANILALLIVLPLLMSFASASEFLRSLSFSSGYGVGSVFFSNRSGATNLTTIYVAFALAANISRYHLQGKWTYFKWIFISFLIYQLIKSIANGLDAYNLHAVQALAAACVLAYLWAIKNSANEPALYTNKAHWFVVMLLVYASTIGITSGNGIGQATGAFMVGLPILLMASIGSNSAGATPRSIAYTTTALALVVLFYCAQWSLHPYREARWWETTYPAEGTPEFAFIKTTKERVAFLKTINNELAGITENKRVLLVGEYPGLYFSSNSHIESCMVYMHSVTSDNSEMELINCLEKKHPEVILDIYTSDEPAYLNSRIKTRLRQFYTARGFTCEDRPIKFTSSHDRNPKFLNLRICLIRTSRK